MDFVREDPDPRTWPERRAERKRAHRPPDGAPRLHCSNPPWHAVETFARTLMVKGWAIAESGTAEVTVTVDGGDPYPVKAGIRRSGATGLGPREEWSGWAVVLDAEEWIPGPHVLTVTARDERGRATSVQRFVHHDPEGLYGSWRARRDPTRWRALATDPMVEKALPRIAVLLDYGEVEKERMAEDRGGTQLAPAAHELLEIDLHAVSGTGEALEQLLAGEADYGLLARAGDALEADAPLAIAVTAAITGYPDLIYADHDVTDGLGRRRSPRFKPQWSPELLLSTDYVGPFVALGREAARAALDAEGAPPSSAYDVLLRLLDADVHVERVPDVLVGLADGGPPNDEREAELVRAAVRRRGPSADVRPLGPGRRCVTWEPTGRPKVSAVVTSGVREDLLVKLLASVHEHTSYNRLEIVVVNSGEELDLASRWLDGLEHRVVRAPGPFNYSAANNLGARAATGDYLLFLNDDVEVLTPRWIERLVGQAQHPGVGKVGVKLDYPGGHVEHAGVLIGSLTEMPRTQLHLHAPGTAGSEHMLELTRNSAAVGTACAMLPARLFWDLGGFDEALVMELNDVDLSLRVWNAGRRVVWTPEVVLTHHRRASRGSDSWPGDRDRFRRRWESLLRSGDPFFNPNLKLVPEHEIADAPPDVEQLRRSLERLPGAPPWRPTMLTTPAGPAPVLAPS